MTAQENPDEPLLRAIKDGDVEGLRTLIAGRPGGVDGTLGKNTYVEKRIIDVCANESQWALVQALLDWGADPVPYPNAYMDVLSTAVHKGAPEDLLRALVAAGADPFQRHPQRGEGRLWWAAVGDNAGAARWLLELGLPPYETNTAGQSILQPIVEHGSLAVLDVLEAAGLQIPDEFLLSVLVLREDPDEIRRLLTTRDVNAPDPGEQRPLELAVSLKRYASAEVLLAAGADPDLAGPYWTPLEIACRLRDLRLIELLLEAGADVNRINGDGETPLLFLFHYNEGTTAEQLDVARFLIARGALLYYRHENRFERDVATCFLGSLDDRTWNEGEAEILRLFLTAGSTELVAGKRGAEMLHLAIRDGRADALRMLLAAGVSPEAEDREKVKAVVRAVRRGRADLLEILIRAGATLPERDEVDRSLWRGPGTAATRTRWRSSSVISPSPITNLRPRALARRSSTTIPPRWNASSRPVSIRTPKCRRTIRRSRWRFPRTDRR